jgi:hypothetical protein
VARFETSPKLRRRAGLRRLGPLLRELRALRELRERQPGAFHHGTGPFLHFHYHPDGSIIADVLLSRRGVTEFDVSDEAGQQELLSTIERYLNDQGGSSRRGRSGAPTSSPPGVDR